MSYFLAQRGYLIEFKQLVIHNVWIVLIFIVWLFVIQQSENYSRQIILTMYPISVCIMTVARLSWKRIVRMQRKHRKEDRKLLVVTTSERAEAVVKDLFIPYRDYMIEGIVLYDQERKTGEKIIASIPVCAGKNDLITYIQNNVIDEVFIDLKDNETEVIILMNLLVNMG